VVSISQIKIAILIGLWCLCKANNIYYLVVKMISWELGTGRKVCRFFSAISLNNDFLISSISGIIFYNKFTNIKPGNN
jgi:hypothetical protein